MGSSSSQYALLLCSIDVDVVDGPIVYDNNSLMSKSLIKWLSIRTLISCVSSSFEVPVPDSDDDISIDSIAFSFQ